MIETLLKALLNDGYTVTFAQSGTAYTARVTGDNGAGNGHGATLETALAMAMIVSDCVGDCGK